MTKKIIYTPKGLMANKENLTKLFKFFKYLINGYRINYKSYFVFTMFFLGGVFTAQSEKMKWAMTSDIVQAYQEVTTLRMQEGQKTLNRVRQQDPHNAMLHYIENYIDFFTVFIKEEKQDYITFLANKDKRLKIIAQSDPNSPYFLFCQAEIILQVATVKLKFDDKVSAANDVFQAYKMLEENKNLFPNFLENNKSLSIIYALADSLPSWVRKLLGIKGSVLQATHDIKKLTDKAFAENNMFKDEIVAIYSYILFYVNEQREDAYHLFDKYKCNHKTNPLIAFLKATFAQKNNQTNTAIKILEERPKGSQYLDFYYLDYLYGKYKLYNLDSDADKHINKFLTNFKGRHYIKEAYQKIAWYHWAVNKDKTSYNKSMKKVVNNGHALIDEDKQALKEAKSHALPDIHLLKARLLYDGGYFAKAQNILLAQAYNYKNNIKHDGEYYYRMGRIYDGQKKYNDAIEYYKMTLQKSDAQKYFACSAALYLAIIYEQKKNLSLAKKYYEKCLSFQPSEYASSLHQKAKTGLQRLK